MNYLLGNWTCSLRPLLVGVLFVVHSAAAISQPSQVPLLNRTGGGVAPNLVLNLDESGSMMYQHMPEGAFNLAGASLTLAGDNSLRMHPLDTRTFGGTFRGTWPADVFATGTALNYQQQVRSSDVNTLYYDSNTTYLPWIKTDGTRYPNAVMSAAQFNPLVASTFVAGVVPQITFVGAGGGVTASSGNIPTALPGGIVAGDFLICLSESYDLVSHTAPVGWTLIYNVKGTATHSASAIYKIAVGGDVAPTIGHPGGSSITSRCYAYRGVDTVAPFDVGYTALNSATSNVVGDTTIDTGTITTVSADAMILMASHQANRFATLNVTAGGGFAWSLAGIANFNGSGAADVAVGLNHAIKATPGLVTSRVATSDRAERNSGVLIALKRTSVAGASTATNGANLLAPASVITADWCLAATGGCPSSSLSYTPMLYYQLQKNPDGSLKDPTVTANYDTFNLNTAPAATTYSRPTRTDCTLGVCTLTQERQNFANWFVYHRSRLLVAQSAVAESFWNIDENKLRVGWGHIHKGYGVLDNGESTATLVAGVRKFTTTRKDALFDFIRTITVNSGTPLRSALYGVGEYYTKASPWADDPSNMAFADPVGSGPKDCRRAYHLLVTDGLWNTTGAPFTPTVGNYDNTLTTGFYPTITSTSATAYTYVPQAPYADNNSDYLADFASYFFNRDLRDTLNNNLQPSPPSKLSWQGMVNFVVGIGLKGNLDPAKDLSDLTNGVKTWGTNKVDDLWHAAVNSEGKYFSARNSSELANSLTTALNATLQVELKEAGVATTTNVLEDGNRKYVPIYKSGKWTGDIRAFELDANGATKVGPGPNGELWSVAGKMPVWASRKIYTWNQSTGAPSLFTWADMGLLNQAAVGPAPGSSALIDYLRGDKSLEETAILSANPYRARDSILGDMVNSNPVFVKKGTDLGYQGLAIGGSSYDTYRKDVKAVRPGVLFAGANDGMLHAFSDTQGVSPNDGEELFAYVPRTVYSNLTKLADKSYGSALLNHQFFVDGAFGETDAYVKATPSSPGAEWRNYLVGSLGAGGRGVLALDVTDMSSPGPANIKWEFSGDSDLGYVSAPIEVGVLPDNTWVAIFGNGPLSPSGKAILFVVNLETGVGEKIEVDGVTAANGLGGAGVVRDGAGYIKSIYAGDLTGKLWKLNYNAAATGKFSVEGSGPMFIATDSGGVAQAITQPPAIFDNPTGGKIVVFGTGKLLVTADRDDTTVQTIYGVMDKAADTFTRPMSRSILEGRNISKVDGSDGAVFYSLTGNPVNVATQRGWMVDLTSGSPDILLGERVIYPPQRITSGLVLVSAVAPAQKAEVCSSATGLGVNLVLPIDTGANPTEPTFDTNGDGVIDSSDGLVAGVATKVDGVDALVYGKQGICPIGFIQVSIQNTEGSTNICVPDGKPPAGSGTSIQDRIWRQIINPPIR